MSTKLALLALAAAMTTGCIQSEEIDPMMKQPKYRYYQTNPFFSDGRAMRPLPEGTVPRERTLGSLALTTGSDEKGVKAKDFPIAVTRATLETGRKNYEIYCAICHGVVGDGKSLVATQMSLRAPPNLIERKDLVNGHIYEVVNHGFGLMPGYGEHLSVDERWAVVAYVRALQRAGNAPVADATPEGRAQLDKETHP